MGNAFDKANEAQKNKSSGKDNTFKSGSSNKGGRPQKAAADKRESKITVYFSTAEIERLTQYCESVGVQPAVFLRTLALDKAKSDK